MREQSSWTVSLGRWGGVEVRFHVFFFLFAVFTLYLGWSQHQMTMAVMSLGLLGLSVLFHELGHQIVAQRVGIDLDPIVLGPFGGLDTPPEQYSPRAELSVFVAGPIANLIVVLIAAAFLLPSHGFDGVAQMLHPLQPTNLVHDDKLGMVALALWINWVLFLVNLLPVFPFDGGRALRAGISVMWTDISRESAIGLVSGLAKIAAFGLLILTWYSWTDEPQAGANTFPLWLALVLLSIFLFFSAKQEQHRLELEKTIYTSPLIDDVFDDDDDDLGYLEEDHEDAFVDWLEQRRDVERNRQREIEEEEEQLVDEILRQVHERGVESLSEEERSLLQRVSARYRNNRRRV